MLNHNYTSSYSSLNVGFSGEKIISTDNKLSSTSSHYYGSGVRIAVVKNSAANDSLVFKIRERSYGTGGLVSRDS